MGLETEKADTRIFMDDDNFPRSGGPALPEVEKCREDELDRDPSGMNAHLQVRGRGVPAGRAAAQGRGAGGAGSGEGSGERRGQGYPAGRGTLRPPLAPALRHG